uniref:V-type proton ATPase subunit C n=1 Tax=Wollemia nobilis TaxID=56998 RepID=A0A0C9RG98_9CONI
MVQTSKYWLVSLPIQNSASTTWHQLQESISKNAFDTPTYRFHVPELRIGTLDSLLALSDDLVKANSFVEGVTQKIRRQIEDLEKQSSLDTGVLSVEGIPVDAYITRFTWDEAKYPVMSPLRETVNTIHESVSKLEDGLKVRVAEYNNIRSQLNAINRKQTGSLAVRDLSDLVKAEDMISSEHLTTLLAVVPKYSEKEWLSSYETLTTFVVPRSSKELHEDNENALYSVTLFRKVADNFKISAREKGFQIRDFEYDPEAQARRREEMQQILNDQENTRAALQQWCYASYGEVFSSWMHLCAVRLFTESILRYGLPPSFLAAVLAPSPKSEKKVRSFLERLSGGQNSYYWKSEGDDGMTGLAGGEVDTYPYVSFTINLAA